MCILAERLLRHGMNFPVSRTTPRSADAEITARTNRGAVFEDYVRFANHREYYGSGALNTSATSEMVIYALGSSS